jgi:N-acyl amino acid synthase of PEP-CTERM/exosortase system
MNDSEAAFHQYFEIVTADTEELLKEVFNLRFRILCVHNIIPGFNSSNYPEELESDEYDKRSVHILLRHRPTGIFLGTARLILPDREHLHKKFPTELHTRFFPGFALNETSRQHTAEISRFAVLSDFFGRRSKLHMPSQSTNPAQKRQERRRCPHPSLGLAVGIIKLCAQHNIYYWLSSMDPALNRLLGFYGLQLNPIGPSIHYHGIRSPYHACLFDVLDRMHRDHRAIWELVTDHGKIWPIDLTSIRANWLPESNTHYIRASR